MNWYDGHIPDQFSHSHGISETVKQSGWRSGRVPVTKCKFGSEWTTHHPPRKTSSTISATTWGLMMCLLDYTPYMPTQRQTTTSRARIPISLTPTSSGAAPSSSIRQSTPHSIININENPFRTWYTSAPSSSPLVLVQYRLRAVPQPPQDMARRMSGEAANQKSCLSKNMYIKATSTLVYNNNLHDPLRAIQGNHQSRAAATTSTEQSRPQQRSQLLQLNLIINI